MSSRHIPQVPFSGEADGADAAMQRPWRNWRRLSSALNNCDAFLGDPRQDRAPWVIVAFAGGIAAWFGLSGWAEWITFVVLLAVLGGLAAFAWRDQEQRANLRLALIAISLAAIAGLALIWARSAVVGTPPLERPVSAVFDARILERIEQPAQERTRLVLATRNPIDEKPVKVRVNLPQKWDSPALKSGAVIRLKVRLLSLIHI